MGVASDLFTKLPDDLLCSILSDLPIKEAVRSCILSKRWRYLHTQLPKLIIAPDLFMVKRHPDPLSITKVENAISDILLSHSSDLETFDLSTYSKSLLWRFSRENIWKWIQLVASKNIQHLSLRNILLEGMLPPTLFCCNTLTRLELSNYIISNIPPSFGGFQHLITCELLNVIFKDDSLDRLVSLCPQLENLCILNCFGPQTMNISASKITTLRISVCTLPAELYINCPSLISLELLPTKYYHVKDLRVNGLLFQELSSAVWCLEMQGGSNLIELSMVWPTERKLGLSEERFVEIMGTFRSLKEFSIYNACFLKREKDVGILIPSLLQCLPHLERLDLKHVLCLEFRRDPNPSCLDAPLFNVQTVNAFLHDLENKGIALIHSLLETTLALQTMVIRIPKRRARQQKKYRQFLAKLEDLKGAESRAEIRVTEENVLLKLGGDQTFQKFDPIKF